MDQIKINLPETEILAQLAEEAAELAQAALDGMGDNYACILGNHGLLCVGGNISYTLDVSEQIEFCAQLYYNCKAAGQEPKLLNDEQISSVLEAFQTYRQK